MIEKLHEKKLVTDDLFVRPKSTNEETWGIVSRVMLETGITAELSEKSTAVVNNTLNKLFTQGLLNKFHSGEKQSVVILTRNLTNVIQKCIHTNNYIHDIRVNYIEELQQIDSKIDILIAIDFDYETIFFNQITKISRVMNIPMIQFGLADESLYMGPVYLTQNPC